MQPYLIGTRFCVSVSLFLLFIISNLTLVCCLDNGAARTPPLGWTTWTSLGFNVNQDSVLEAADAMVSNGLLAAGYNYVLIDDGWQDCKTRVFS